MFGIFEKYLKSKDVVVVDDTLPQTCLGMEHDYFTNNDGTFCNKCSIQLIDPMPVEEHLQEKSLIGIRKDIEFLNLSPEIVDLTNHYFTMTCKNRIHRGKFRKAIICACLFHVFILKECPQNYDTIIKWFGLNNHYANKGFNKVKLNVPELRYLAESPIETAVMILKLVGIDDHDDCLQFIQQPRILRFVEERISRRMYTNVAAFVYIYLQKQYSHIRLLDFCNKLELHKDVLDRIIHTIKSEIQL